MRLNAVCLLQPLDGGDGRIRTADRGFADPRLNHLATSPGRDMERETGFEPATFSLARRRSTPEPLPQNNFTDSKNAVNEVTCRSIPHRRLNCQGLCEANRVVKGTEEYRFLVSLLGSLLEECLVA